MTGEINSTCYSLQHTQIPQCTAPHFPVHFILDGLCYERSPFVGPQQQQRITLALVDTWVNMQPDHTVESDDGLPAAAAARCTGRGVSEWPTCPMMHIQNLGFAHSCGSVVRRIRPFAGDDTVPAYYLNRPVTLMMTKQYFMLIEFNWERMWNVQSPHLSHWLTLSPLQQTAVV